MTGSQTDAGSSANTYSIAFDKSAKEGNYVHGADTIGSLEVTAAKAEGKISLSGNSAPGLRRQAACGEGRLRGGPDAGCGDH